MEYKDYYKTLGVEKKATQAEIKSAFRKLAKKYHPDMNPGDKKAEKMFKEVNEAYEVLGDENKRKEYDSFGKGFSFMGGQNFDPNKYGFKGFRGFSSSSESSDFSDFFNLIFGGGNRQKTSRSASDIFSGFSSRNVPKSRFDLDLELTVREAYEGTTKIMNVSVNGRNEVLEVKVPKGITKGKKIKVRGEKIGEKNSEIFLKIKIKDDDLSLDGLDVTKKIDIKPYQAALGSSVTVQTMSKKIQVNIPKGVSSGNKVKINNQGFRDMKGNLGDFYLEFRIVIPKHLSEEEKKAYEKLRDLDR